VLPLASRHGECPCRLLCRGYLSSVCGDYSDALNGSPSVRKAQPAGSCSEIVAEYLPVAAPRVLVVGCLDFDLERPGVEQKLPHFLGGIRRLSVLVGRANEDDVPAQHIPMPGLKDEEPPKKRRWSVDRQALDLAFLVGEQDHGGLLDADGLDVAADSLLVVVQACKCFLANRQFPIVGNDHSNDHFDRLPNRECFP